MHIINILDQFGVQTGTIGAVTIDGPARGVTNLVYDPLGSVLSGSGQAAFDVPMTIRRNLALGPGASVEIVDTAIGVMGTYLVTEKSETIANSGHTAAFVCPDLLEELRWQIVAGFAADPGHTSTGPTDPIPTHPAELVADCAQRILNQATETAWTANVSIAGSMTETFAADGSTVQETVASFAKKRYAYYRLGVGRSVEIGRFGYVTNIRLTRASQRPSAMNQPSIRAITDLKVTTDGRGVVNCLVPMGSGTGAVQVSLADYYNPIGEVQIGTTGRYITGAISDPSYNPAYPVYRRRRSDGLGVDGWQYFLADNGSIATYRQRWATLSAPIAPIGTAKAELQAAAADLYLTATAELQWRAVPTVLIDVTTTGAGGDNRAVAGNTVRVEYKESVDGADALNIAGDYYVLAAPRTVTDADGQATDHWKLSSTGLDTQTDAGLVTGMLQALDALASQAPPTLIGGDVQYERLIDANHPVDIPIDADLSLINRLEYTFTVSLLPAIAPINGGIVVPHTHQTTIPALSIDASVPYTSEYAVNPANQHPHNHTNVQRNTPTGQAAYGHSAPSGQFGHGHGNATNSTSGLSGSASASGLSGNTGGGGLSGSTGGGGLSANATNAQIGAEAWHYHDYFIHGSAGTPTTANTLFYGGGAYMSMQQGGQPDLQTGAQEAVDLTPTGHGHPVAGSAGGQGLGSGSAGGQGLGSGTAGGQGLGSGRAGTQGIASEAGFTPSVNQHGGFTPQVGLDDGYGFQPSTYFPGYLNPHTVAQTVQTSGPQSDATFKVQYGYYADPSGAASNIGVYVDNVGIAAGPTGTGFTGDFTIDLGPYLNPASAHTVRFTSATFGRLVIRAKSRARGTTARIGTLG